MSSLYEPILLANVQLDLSKKDKLFSAYTDIVDKKGLRYYVIHLDDKKDFYALLHECVHLTKRVFQDRGVPFNAENDEAIAYYMTYWFKRLWRRLNKEESI